MVGRGQLGDIIEEDAAATAAREHRRPGPLPVAAAPCEAPSTGPVQLRHEERLTLLLLKAWLFNDYSTANQSHHDQGVQDEQAIFVDTIVKCFSRLLRQVEIWLYWHSK